MKFPSTNKIPSEPFGDNIKALEEMSKEIDWNRAMKMYFIGLGVVALTLFVIVFAVNLAISII